MIRFANPLLLCLILLLLPLLRSPRQQLARLRFSSLAAIKRVAAPQNWQPQYWLRLLRVIALGLFVVALARPQSGKKESQAMSEGVDIFLAIDTSGSMKALDFKVGDKPVDRLSVVKGVVSEFIKKRPSDRLGLVVFGEEAFTQCPLTTDHGVLLDLMQEVEHGMAGDATAVGSALGTAVARLKDLKAKERVVILLTDGSSNAGQLTPLKAAELAKSFNIKVYTIGVGTRGKAPFLVDTIFGQQYQYQEVDIDEDTLSQIAQITGGQYFRATDTQKLQEIYAAIDKLERFEVAVKEHTEYFELFHWALIPGLLLLLAELLLTHTRLRTLP